MKAAIFGFAATWASDMRSRHMVCLGDNVPGTESNVDRERKKIGRVCDNAEAPPRTCIC